MTGKREFEIIFRQHYDGMFRLARRMLGDDAESKDVVSDVFAYLLKSNIDLKSDTLQAFLLTSVRNRCINLLVSDASSLHRHADASADPANTPPALPAGTEVSRDS